MSRDSTSIFIFVTRNISTQTHDKTLSFIIAPIAAAMAVAAGAMQVAAIKKQQQASQAQGYGEGGFTRKGRADEVAGVVHAGEWVASQKLVASPVFDRGSGLRAAHQHDWLASQCRRVHKLGCGSAKCKRVCLCARLAPIFKVNHRADGFGAEPTAGDCPGE